MNPAPGFQTIKATVPIEALLERRGILSSFRIFPDTLVGPCPVHGGDNPRGFVVWRKYNRWWCFTRCQRGGDVLDLMTGLEHCTLPEAARLLSDPACLSHRPTPLSTTAGSPRIQKPFRPFCYELPLEPRFPFIQRKGISAETARRFGLGLYTGTGWLRGCVGVRLFDPAGTPLGYAGRCLAPALPHLPKWRFPPGLPAHRLLYNYHRVVAWRARACVLVECAWGVMRLHQLGIPALALMGLSLSEEQERLLLRFSRLVLMMDGDPAGAQAAQSLSTRLSKGARVVVHPLEPGIDPDDLTDFDLEHLRNELDL